MSDIDFDELDKAVTDLMSNVDTSKRTPGADDPVDTVVTIPAHDDAANTSVAPETPAVTTPSESPAKPAPTSADNATPAVAPQAPLAVKRRGQFMDIVHPSLNMTTASSTSRQGATVQPSASAASSPQASAVPSVSAEATTSTNPTQPTDTTTDNSVVKPEDPISSPFLPDAKVEKRPLGSQSDSSPAADMEPTTTSDNDVEDVGNAPTPSPAPLPEELSGDLMAVESRDLSSSGTSTKPADVPVKASGEPVDDSTKDTSKQAPSAPSIQQQYTEQPSSGDQTNGSIYDTDKYHQPIEASHKKSSPLTWIIWLVVLLLVGAAAGAAYFYFTR